MQALPLPVYIATALLTTHVALAAADALSVEQTVTLALERNADLAAASWRVGQATAQLQAARAGFLPWLGVDLSARRADAPSVYLFKTIDSRELPAMVDFNDPGLLNNVESGVTLRYALWDAGRRRLRYSQASEHAAATQESRDAVANELIGSVIQAYYDILAAAEFVGVAERSLSTVEEQLRETKVRHENGGALRADVLAIEVRQAEAQERLISARNADALARAAMRRLLDFAAEEPVQLSGEEWDPAALPDDFAAAWQVATDNRPELAALQHQLAAAESGVGLAGREWWPRLDLTARYWADDNGAKLDAAHDNWSVGATLSWDLLDGGLRRARQQEARAAQEEMAARRRAVIRAIELQVRAALLNLQEARTRSQVAQANVARAEETLRLVKELFDGGSVTVTRYLQTEQDRTAALFREIKGRYDVKQAKARLGHVLGLCLRCAAKGATP